MSTPTIYNVAGPVQFGTGDGTTFKFQLADPTTGNPVQDVIAATLYRNDWQGNQLLYATPRTNLLLQSQGLNTASWTVSATSVTANATTAPDGTATAAKVVESATAAPHYCFPSLVTVTTGLMYAQSIYAKAAERSILQIGLSTGFDTSRYQNFNLSTGALGNGNLPAGTTASITAIGSGWYRCDVAAPATGASARMIFVLLQADTPSRNPSYTGDGTSGLYLWGAQFESGSVDTSYIPTTTAAVTVTDYALTQIGAVTMGTAATPMPPVSGAALTWAGSYVYPPRNVTLALPTPQFASIGKEGNGALSGSVALSLPVPLILSIGDEEALGNVALTLPTPVINTASMWYGNAALTLPTPKLNQQGVLGASGDVAFALPLPVPAIAGNGSPTATVLGALPMPTLAMVGTTPQVAEVALALPMPRFTASGANSVGLTLPVPQLVASGGTGRIGRMQLVLPTPQLTAQADVPYAGGAMLALPVPRLQIAGTPGGVSNVALALRGLALAAEGATGTVGSVALTLPVQPTLDNDWQGGLAISGSELPVGIVTLVLPMLHLQATGQVNADTPDAPDGNVFPAMVMHTETGALWDYTNYPFNSLCMFNGQYLGASAEGLFVLTGDTDNAVPIQAAARVGMTDFGTSFLKRIDRCYVGYRTDGNLVLRVFTDEVNVRDYLITAYGKDGLHGNHTRIGKGLAARYWQFELRNQNGADFELNALELKPTHLRRRIGGGDA